MKSTVASPSSDGDLPTNANHQKISIDFALQVAERSSSIKSWIIIWLGMLGLLFEVFGRYCRATRATKPPDKCDSRITPLVIDADVGHLHLALSLFAPR